MIRTERLSIRYIEMNDVDDIWEYVSNPYLMRFERVEFLSKVEVERHIKWFVDTKSAYVISLANEKKVFGQITLTKNEEAVYNLGFILNQDYHGKGYCTEAARAVIEYGFESMQVKKVVATCNPENIASWKVLEKIGFERVDHLKESVSYRDDENGNPIRTDQYIYEMNKEVFYG